MGESTEELSNDIEATRARLSRDIDELGHKVSPSEVMQRRKEAAKGKVSGMRDRVMGSAQDVGQGASSMGQSVGESVTGGASSAVHGIESRTEGNPLAAGVIAFGAGMLLSSLLPATQTEQRVAQQGIDAAKEQGQPLMDEAKSVGQEMGEHLKEAGTQAADEVKSTAQESAQHVRDEGQSSAQNVKDTAQDSGSSSSGSGGGSGSGSST